MTPTIVATSAKIVSADRRQSLFVTFIDIPPCGLSCYPVSVVALVKPPADFWVKDIS
jgi:hypothetical protein